MRFHVLKYQLSFRDLWDITVQTTKKTTSDDCLGLAAQIAFHFIFSFFPWMLFLMALLGFIGRRVNYSLETSSLFTSIFPAEITALFQVNLDHLIQVNSGGLILLGLLGMIWSASRVVNALTGALDKAYGQRRKHAFILNRLYSMIFILLSGLLILICFLLIAFGPTLAAQISNSLGLAGQDKNLRFLWGLTRWPLAFLLLSFLLTLIYRYLPSKSHPFFTLWPGSMLAVILWMALSYFLGLYLRMSPDFHRMYGSLGALISILVWVHLSAFIFLAGAELNATLEAHLKEKQ